MCRDREGPKESRPSSDQGTARSGLSMAMPLTSPNFSATLYVRVGERFYQSDGKRPNGYGTWLSEAPGGPEASQVTLSALACER